MVKPGRSCRLTVELSNEGDFDVEDCKVILSGLSAEWKVDDKSFSEFVEKEIDIGKGDTEKVKWNLKAPDRELSYPFTITISYPYKTVFDALIKVVSESYAEERNEKGGVVSAKVTKGPLSIEIRSDNDFVSEENIPVEVTVTNVGGGIIEGNKVSIDLSNSEGIKCETNLIEFEDATTTEATIDCELITKKKVTTYENLPVSLTLTYYYQIEEEGNIEVTSE